MTPTDTGPIVALLDSKDKHHASCVAAAKRLPQPFLTTWPCLTESMHLLGRALGHAAQDALWAKVLPEYVREVIQTPLGRAFFQSNARTAVGMWKIGGEDIKNFPIPLPPSDIQREIVEKIQEQRARIAEQRAMMERQAAEVKQEVEEMIIGIRPVPDPALLSSESSL